MIKYSVMAILLLAFCFSAYAEEEEKEPVYEGKTLSEWMKQLQDENTDSRAQAAWSLGQIGNKVAVPELIRVIKDNEIYVRIETIIALGKIGDKSAVPELIKALEDEEDTINAKAREALIKIGKPAVPEIIKALEENKNAILNQSTIRVLGWIGDKTAISALEKAVYYKGDLTSHYAILALYGIGEPAVPVLIKLLKAKDANNATTNVTDSSMYVLTSIGDKSAIPHIIKILNDENKNTRELAARQLREFTGLDFGVKLEAWEKWWNENKDKPEPSNKDIVAFIEKYLTMSNHDQVKNYGKIKAFGEKRLLPLIVPLLKKEELTLDNLWNEERHAPHTTIMDVLKFCIYYSSSPPNLIKTLCPKLISENANERGWSNYLLYNLNFPNEVENIAELLKNEKNDLVKYLILRRLYYSLSNSLDVHRFKYQKSHWRMQLTDELKKCLLSKDKHIVDTAAYCIALIPSAQTTKIIVDSIKLKKSYFHIFTNTLNRRLDDPVFRNCKPSKSQMYSMVPSLINFVDGDSTVSEIMRKITQQNFGKDSAKWRAWWDENKERILKEEAEKDKPKGENK